MGLPAERRLRRSSDVTAVVRRGDRARAGGLVVHAARRGVAAGPASAAGSAGEGTGTAQEHRAGGPRLAFVAPRAVGSAVRRNRTRRRVQEQVRSLVDEGRLVDDVDLVVRLLPAAADAGSSDLGRQLRHALGRLGVLSRGQG